jgi:crotonobetainyl-CoA:carnitine CoA-transferase CaiB-like acyl-CoA transferase
MASGPLDGIRILEFTQIIAGPLGCQLLADLGAEVIKVEPPEGEPWRLNVQFIPLESKTFMGLNRGKKSLAIDVGRPEAQDVIHRLTSEVDVVVINYRPDVAQRLKIDYETLRAIKPDLVYLDNTAFGREGEWAQRPGYDIVVQAATGLTSQVGKVDDKGNPVVPPAFADTTTGYAICAGVLAALFHRARTGEGQKVETSLMINALTTHMSMFMSVPAADAEVRAAFLDMLATARAEGVPYAELLRRRDEVLARQAGGNVYYRCFQTKDGALAIGALSASLREKVRRALGFEHNRDEPGYDQTDPKQQEINQQVVEQVEALFMTNTTEYWERRLTEGGVPVAPVLFVQELVDHPQVVANGYAVELEHDLAGPLKMQAPPWKMSVTPPAPQGASPPLGRDNEAILTQAGYSAEEIEAMRSSGAIL